MEIEGEVDRGDAAAVNHSGRTVAENFNKAHCPEPPPAVDSIPKPGPEISIDRGKSVCSAFINGVQNVLSIDDDG